MLTLVSVNSSTAHFLHRPSGLICITGSRRKSFGCHLDDGRHRLRDGPGQALHSNKDNPSTGFERLSHSDSFGKSGP